MPPGARWSTRESVGSRAPGSRATRSSAVGRDRSEIKRFSVIRRPCSRPTLGLEPRNSPASRRGPQIQATEQARRFAHAPQTTCLYLAEPATGDRA